MAGDATSQSSFVIIAASRLGLQREMGVKRSAEGALDERRSAPAQPGGSMLQLSREGGDAGGDASVNTAAAVTGSSVLGQLLNQLHRARQLPTSWFGY